MSLSIRRAASGLAVVVLTGAALLGTAASGHATTTPPWEPDPSSVGGLLFFNSSGQRITGGSTSDQPVAAYVEGTTTIRNGDTKATLLGYLPVKGDVPGKWQGEAMSVATVYPNAGAPGALGTASLPVQTGSSGDESLATLAVDFPNNDTSGDGYAGMYQLRLVTSGPDLQPTTSYDSADIQITGDTWSVVYDQTALTTRTSLSVSPSGTAYHGSSVTLKATVSPSNAAGSVGFYDGSKLLHSVKVSGGKATYTTKSLSDAKYKLKAVFTPTDATAFSSSTSSAKTLSVKAHPTKTSLKASASSIKKGKKLTLTATESPKAAGKITFYDGKKKLGTAKVAKGKATLSVSSLKPGTHKLTAKFTPASVADDAASTSKVVKVKVTG
ncbi:MAG TPA: Ig-like domain-containing protein [Mycobacteriales bacterium]|nr:Ig-like domain-containing protein [Mycobacteriales bacterium]